MEINYKIKEEVPFKEIEIGDCFIYVNKIYMKIPEVRDCTDGILKNSVVMGTCSLDAFTNTCPVYKCKAVLNVENNNS